MKNEAVNDEGVREVEESGGIDVDWATDARAGMINAVKAATDAGAFPRVLVTVAPPSDARPDGKCRPELRERGGPNATTVADRPALAVRVAGDPSERVNEMGFHRMCTVLGCVPPAFDGTPLIIV